LFPTGGVEGDIEETGLNDAVFSDFIDVRTKRHALLPDFNVFKLFDSSHNSSFYS
jgi:hypothetical protein